MLSAQWRPLEAVAEALPHPKSTSMSPPALYASLTYSIKILGTLHPSLPFPSASKPSLKNTNVAQRIAGDLSWHPWHFVPYGTHTYATDEKIMILFLRSLRDLNKWIRFGGEKDNTKKVLLNDFARAVTPTVLAQATPSHNNTRHKRTLIIQHYSKNAWITLPYWDFHCCILCTESVTWSPGREGQLRRQATALNLVDDARRRTFFGACEARGLPGGSPLRPSVRPSPPPSLARSRGSSESHGSQPEFASPLRVNRPSAILVARPLGETASRVTMSCPGQRQAICCSSDTNSSYTNVY